MTVERRAARPAGRGDRRHAPTSSRSRPCSPPRARSPTSTRSPRRRAHHGALTVIDATHAIGWLPLDASRFDAVACAVLQVADVPARHGVPGPRASALAERMTPHQAGWFAASDPLKDQFGPPLRLPDTARRFDTSPAWFSWVGTEPALKLLNEIGVEAIHEHDLRLANRFRAGLGLRAVGLRDRHHRRPGRHGEARAGGDHGRRPRRAGCARPSTSTTPRRTSTRRSARYLDEPGQCERHRPDRAGVERRRRR